MSNLWVTVEELGPTHSSSVYAYDAVSAASYLMWSMSGRKFSGITTVTERYVSTFDPHLYLGGSASTSLPVLVDGSVINIPGGGGGDLSEWYGGDGTSSRSTLRLRGRKVIKIHNLRDKSGNIIPPNQYYLAEHSTIIATPGAQWNPNNIEVTYTYGTPPPQAGKSAAKIFAIELVKLYEGDDTCTLPQRTTSVTRQGVAYTILDSQEYLNELRTSIYAVDLFLQAVNPDKARARSRVFSPDVSKARRVNPKPYVYSQSTSDLIVLPTGGTNGLYLSEIGATFILSDPAWVLSISVSNYTNTVSAVLPNITSVDSIKGIINVNVTYASILAIIGRTESGTYDLYATRPSIGNPSIPEIVHILSANTYIQLATRINPVFTV